MPLVKCNNKKISFVCLNLFPQLKLLRNIDLLRNIYLFIENNFQKCYYKVSSCHLFQHFSWTNHETFTISSRNPDFLNIKKHFEELRFACISKKKAPKMTNNFSAKVTILFILKCQCITGPNWVSWDSQWGGICFTAASSLCWSPLLHCEMNTVIVTMRNWPSLLI